MKKSVPQVGERRNDEWRQVVILDFVSFTIKVSQTDHVHLAESWAELEMNMQRAEGARLDKVEWNTETTQFSVR